LNDSFLVETGALPPRQKSIFVKLPRMKRVRGYCGDLILKRAKNHNSKIKNVNLIGDLAELWWVRANHQGPRSPDRLKTAAQFFTHANSRFKSALQPLESNHLRRLASGPEIDSLLRRFDTLQTTCCTQLSRNHVRLPCSK
jgi:hypothetical protein